MVATSQDWGFGQASMHATMTGLPSPKGKCIWRTMNQDWEYVSLGIVTETKDGPDPL